MKSPFLLRKVYGSAMKSPEYPLESLYFFMVSTYFCIYFSIFLHICPWFSIFLHMFPWFRNSNLDSRRTSRFRVPVPSSRAMAFTHSTASSAKVLAPRGSGWKFRQWPGRFHRDSRFGRGTRFLAEVSGDFMGSSWDFHGNFMGCLTHRIHVCHIWYHLPSIYPKC